MLKAVRSSWPSVSELNLKSLELGDASVHISKPANSGNKPCELICDFQKPDDAVSQAACVLALESSARNVELLELDLHGSFSYVTSARGTQPTPGTSDRYQHALSIPVSARAVMLRLLSLAGDKTQVSLYRLAIRPSQSGHSEAAGASTSSQAGQVREFLQHATQAGSADARVVPEYLQVLSAKAGGAGGAAAALASAVANSIMQQVPQPLAAEAHASTPLGTRANAETSTGGQSSGSAQSAGLGVTGGDAMLALAMQMMSMMQRIESSVAALHTRLDGLESMVAALQPAVPGDEGPAVSRPVLNS